MPIGEHVESLWKLDPKESMENGEAVIAQGKERILGAKPTHSRILSQVTAHSSVTFPANADRPSCG